MFYDHSFPLRTNTQKRMRHGISNAASRNLKEEYEGIGTLYRSMK